MIPTSDKNAERIIRLRCIRFRVSPEKVMRSKEEIDKIREAKLKHESNSLEIVAGRRIVLPHNYDVKVMKW